MRVPGANPSLSRHHRQPARIYGWNGVSPTVSCDRRVFVEIDGRVRKLTLAELARLQQFPMWWDWSEASEGEFNTMVGNAVPLAMGTVVAGRLRAALVG